MHMKEETWTFFYVPGAYLNYEIPEDKFILLNIDGEFVDIMWEVNPEHKKNARVENGVKVLYVCTTVV